MDSNDHVISENTWKIKQLKNEIENLQEMVSSAIKKRESLEERVAIQENQIKEYEIINDKLRNELNSIIDNCKQSKSIPKSLKEMIRERGERIAKIENEIEFLHKERIQFLSEQNSFLKQSYEDQKTLDEKIISNSFFQQKQIKRLFFTSMIVGISLVMIFPIYSVFVSDSIQGIQYKMDGMGAIKSSYVIENLRGDTIDTWLSWNIVKGDILYVNIINSDEFPEKAEIIKNTIMSNDVITIDDSLLHKGPKGQTSEYYKGWSGALKAVSAKKDTLLYIPQNLKITDSKTGQGNIIIQLEKTSNADGYSGFTKSIADESQHQILKSQITIYDVNKISNEELETIIRHEFGHALGLAHSTAPEDLMFPTIQTNYPYISQCDIDTLVGLYDGKLKSQVVCEK